MSKPYGEDSHDRRVRRPGQALEGKVNLLVIHEVNYSSKIIYEFQILPEILSMLGHSVTIVDYDDTWKNLPKTSVFRRRRVLKNTQRAYAEASVTVHTPGMIGVPLLSRISGAISCGMEILRVMGSRRFDAVVLYGLPTVGVQALCAARAFRVPILFRSIDVLNQLVPYPALKGPTKVLERFIYRRVDGISCVTPHLKAHIEACGAPPSRVEVLPSGVDVGLFSPGQRDEALLARWGICGSDPVILFMGTLYSFSGLDVVIAGFEQILKAHAGARLLIVGDGEDQERLRFLASEHGIDKHVIFTGRQPYALLPDIIRSSDLCINPFEVNPITRNILPTKLFQYLACGKPVLMTELPGTLPFLKGPQDGVVYCSLDNFADMLRDLLGDRSRLKKLGIASLQVAHRDYDWQTIARRFAGWIQSAMN